MTRMHLFLPLLLVSLPVAVQAKDEKSAPNPTHSDLFVDAVVASVDGRPITLLEVVSHLSPPRSLSLKQAADDIQARQVLDALILDELIKTEAEARKMSVSTEEIDSYIDEVAKRNNLSREAFEAELVSEKKSLQEYRNFVTNEILKSRLAASFVRNSGGVSKEEIDRYLEDHPEIMKSGSEVELRQILVRTDSRSEAEAQQILESIKTKLERGDSFEDLAEKYSESADAAEGGLLGRVADEDLSPEVFESIYSLKKGEVSEITRSPAGLHLFQVEDRHLKQGHDTKVRDQARRVLESERMQEKLGTFFTTELFKLHTVDKKI